MALFGFRALITLRLEKHFGTWAGKGPVARTPVSTAPQLTDRQVVIVDLGPGWRAVVRWSSAPPQAATVNSPLTTPLPVPSLAEIALSRAQRLESRGRLREALDALDPIAIGDPLRARADELKASMQRRLLAIARGDAPPVENAPRRP